jgi:hypothetical protein
MSESEHPNDRQVAGNHYVNQYQHWDMAAEFFGPGYFKGQVTKYVTRWRKKNGVQDLLKAQHFMEKMVSVDWGGLGWEIVGTQSLSLMFYAEANDLTPLEQSVVNAVARCADVPEMEYALAQLNRLVAEAKATEPQAAGYVQQD